LNWTIGTAVDPAPGVQEKLRQLCDVATGRPYLSARVPRLERTGNSLDISNVRLVSTFNSIKHGPGVDPQRRAQHGRREVLNARAACFFNQGEKQAHELRVVVHAKNNPWSDLAPAVRLRKQVPRGYF
jgi:hypothetical protein